MAQGSGGIAFNGLTPDMMQQIQRLLDAEEKAKTQAPAEQTAEKAAEKPARKKKEKAAKAEQAAPVVQEFELPAQDAGIQVVVDNGQALASQRPARELGVV